MRKSDRGSILLNTRTPWDEPPRARHQLAEALTQTHHVYFVSSNEYGSPRLRRLEAGPNITVLAPYWPARPKVRYRYPIVNEVYQRWLFPQLRSMLDVDAVINFDHTATQLIEYFPRFAYYCNDYHIRNYPPMVTRRYFQWCEKTVARQAKVCISTCEYLRNRLSQWNPRSFEVRLGAPFVERPPAPRKKEGPVKVVLVDYVNERKTSFDLIKGVAADPRLKLTIYGPVTPGAEKELKSAANIQRGGVLTGDELLRELRKFDVGIVPYKLNDGNPGRTPNKLWLYLACGLPCVATDVPAIRRWELPQGFLYRATGAEQFRNSIHRAYQEDDLGRMRQRYEFSQIHSWPRRAEHVLSLLERHIGQPGRVHAEASSVTG